MGTTFGKVGNIIDSKDIARFLERVPMIHTVDASENWEILSISTFAHWISESSISQLLSLSSHQIKSAFLPAERPKVADVVAPSLSAEERISLRHSRACRLGFWTRQKTIQPKNTKQQKETKKLWSLGLWKVVSGLETIFRHLSQYHGEEAHLQVYETPGKKGRNFT